MKSIINLIVLFCVISSQSLSQKNNDTTNAKKYLTDTTIKYNAIGRSYSVGYSMPANSNMVSGFQGSFDLNYINPKVGMFTLGWGFSLNLTNDKNYQSVVYHYFRLGYSLSFLQKGVANFLVTYNNVGASQNKIDFKEKGVGWSTEFNYPILVIKKERFLDIYVGYNYLNLKEVNFSTFNIGIRGYDIMKAWKAKK